MAEKGLMQKHWKQTRSKESNKSLSVKNAKETRLELKNQGFYFLERLTQQKVPITLFGKRRKS